MLAQVHPTILKTAHERHVCFSSHRLSLFYLSAQIQIESTPATAASSPSSGAPRQPARGGRRRQRAAELRGVLTRAGAGSWRASPRGAMTRWAPTAAGSGAPGAGSARRGGWQRSRGGQPPLRLLLLGAPPSPDLPSAWSSSSSPVLDMPGAERGGR
jgi:hypothetical protein